jgi:hypothetical protein
VYDAEELPELTPGARITRLYEAFAVTNTKASDIRRLLA